MSRARLAILAASAIVLAIALYFALRPSDESRIKAQMTKLAAIARVTEDDASINPIGRLAHVSDALEGVMDHDVRVTIDELGPIPIGRRAIAERLVAAPRFVRTLDVDFEHVEVKLDDAHESALVGATAHVRVRETSNETRDDRRAVDLRFVKQSGDWLVTTLTVWPPADARPE